MTDHLPPGRRLDVMIERRIFGREPKSKAPCRHCGAETYGRGTGCAYADCKHDGPDLDRVPHYSTEIGAAELVMDDIRSRGFSVRIQIVANDHVCTFYGTGWPHGATAPTLAHAVCLAALKAAG